MLKVCYILRLFGGKLGVKAKIIGATLSMSTIGGGAALMLHESHGYEPNNVIQVSESCSINEQVGSLACHDVVTPSYNEIADGLNRRALLMVAPFAMGIGAVGAVLAVGGIAKSRRYD